MAKWTKLLIPALLFSSWSGSALDTDTDKFFNTKNDLAKDLPKDQIYPRGQIFPFSFYSTGGGSVNKREELLPVQEKDADMKYIVDGGVTMIGPQYELNAQVVDDAKKYKVKAIYTITPVIDGEKVNIKYLHKLNKEKKALDLEKLRSSVSEIVKREAVNPEIAWWDITPEELRNWMKDDMLCLKTVSEAIQENDPLKRPMFMYEPGHRDAKSLAKTAIYQNICAKGMYTNYAGQKKSRVYCRWSIEQEVEGLKLAGMKNSIPLALPEMFQDPPENEIPMIETWVRHDVYSALITGAKGVMVFSASKRPNFKTRELYLDAYLKVCRELTGEMNLGRIFLFGEVRDDISITVTEGPETLEIPVGKDNELKLDNKPQTLPSVGMLDLAYDNSRYIFIANSSNSEVSAMVDGLVYGSGVTVQNVFNPKNIFTAPEGNFSITLKPLEIKALKIFNAVKK